MPDNTEVVRRLFDAVERRDLDGLLAVYHEEVSITEPASLPYGGTYRGHDGVREHAIGFMRCWGPFQGQAEARLDPVFMQDDDGKVAAVFRHRALDPASGERLDGEHLFNDLGSVVRSLRSQVSRGGQLHLSGLVGEARRVDAISRRCIVPGRSPALAPPPSCAPRWTIRCPSASRAVWRTRSSRARDLRAALRRLQHGVCAGWRSRRRVTVATRKTSAPRA
jgi:ketosteroid isomerase-like protein